MASQVDKNPISALRERMDITQEELAQWTGLTKGFIMRLEQGTVTRPSWDFLMSVTPNEDAATTLALRYDLWKVQQRRSNFEPLYVEMMLDDWGGDWVKLRKTISNSRVGFCKLYCIHPGVMENFEKRPRSKFTPYLREVFLDTGIPLADLELAEQKMGAYVG